MLLVARGRLGQGSDRQMSWVVSQRQLSVIAGILLEWTNPTSPLRCGTPCSRIYETFEISSPELIPFTEISQAAARQRECQLGLICRCSPW